MSWKPIVVGVDASLEAAKAAAFASTLADRAGTSCHLVHVKRDASSWLEVAQLVRYREAVIAQAHVELAKRLRNIVPAETLDTLTVTIGAPSVVLRQFAADLDADLIVLGGKHHAAPDRWFGGSTGLNVARTTTVPLLVTAGPVATVHRVLVAVDLSPAARPTLAAAQRYAGLLGAELRALSVLEPLPVIPDIPTPDMSGYYALCEDQLRRDVWPLISTPGVETLVRYGMAVETILREAADWRADLVVVGSHGKGWAERLLIGSVTERLLNHLPTSLLVIPVAATSKPFRSETVQESVAALVMG